MNQLDIWDGVLFGIAGYVAVISLVRLMVAHRNQLMGHLLQQLQLERLRRRQEEKRKQAADEQRRPAA